MRMYRLCRSELSIFIDSNRVNCLAALSKCSNLRRLNLSFVSESIAMSDLLRSTSTLLKLESLHLPRSSAHDSSRDVLIYSWPSKLRELHISGGLHDESALGLSTLPRSLSYLSIGNCPHLSMLFISPLLKQIGSQLQYLEIVAPYPDSDWVMVFSPISRTWYQIYVT